MQTKNLTDAGEVVLLAEVTKASNKTFTDIDLSPYRSVVLCGYKYSNSIDVHVAATTIPKNLLTVNSKYWTKYVAGGTDNSFGLARTANQTFTLEASGADNYGARFYGIK